MFFRSMLLVSTGVWAVACGLGTPAQQDGSSVQEAWKPHDEPLNLAPDYDRRLDSLPASAQLAKAPWPDTYWPSYEGGISARWASNDPQHFTYESPTREALLTMSLEEKAQLSPAEKFDILKGDYSYSLVRSERMRTSPTKPSWEGLCHGWAAASMLYDEPAPATVTNADGIEIPFGSADIKGLITYYQGQVARPQSQFLGLRCNVAIDDYNDPRAREDDCKGVNAGAFHVVLANQIGLRNEGFVVDVTRDLEVWNHPVSGFQSLISPKADISPTAAPGTVREVMVETTMYYVVESMPQWSKLNAADYTSERTYVYTLEIDASGAIIGGEWLQEDRPDFMWKQGRDAFSRGFEALEDLYRASAGN
jgi:hypothetical protein